MGTWKRLLEKNNNGTLVKNAQKNNKIVLKTHKNAETRKKLLTNKKSCASMHKVAEGTTENKATREYLKGYGPKAE